MSARNRRAEVERLRVEVEELKAHNLARVRRVEAVQQRSHVAIEEAETRAEKAEALVEAATRFVFDGPDGRAASVARLYSPSHGGWSVDRVYPDGDYELESRGLTKTEAIAAARWLAGKKEE